MPAAAPLPGTPSSEDELRHLGFIPLDLSVKRTGLRLPFGTGCDWDSSGHIPDGPGHYLFTVEDGFRLHVAYAGLTTHLWMVTKGYLPRSGGARGGQRYGRPTHAGVTRKRINVLVTEQMNHGRIVRHWVRAFHESNQGGDLGTALKAEEEMLIGKWQLRRTGWNRG
jgi:hypothetical protein